MPQYVIQRSLAAPGPAATDGPVDTDSAASPERAAGEMLELGPDVRWLKSYVTERKIYCLYDASSEEILRAHARARGFPADVIERVWAVSSTNGPGR